jgi:hypothetical protein
VSLPANVADLQQILETDGSVWTVNGAGKGLERRVDQTAKEAFLWVKARPTQQA